MTKHIQNWGAHWFNPEGKKVLLKFVLSTLTIFQCVGLVVLKGILGKISQNMRNFLWEGGKTNTKKIHLLNWKYNMSASGEGRLIHS
jgi:hypothetical protein